MLRYKTESRPGLVALYYIRPGNGAGLFLQPWSPHGAIASINFSGQSPQTSNRDLSLNTTGNRSPKTFSNWPACSIMKLFMPSMKHITLTMVVSKLQTKQETQLSLTNCTTWLEVSQGHQIWYHSIC